MSTNRKPFSIQQLEDAANNELSSFDGTPQLYSNSYEGGDRSEANYEGGNFSEVSYDGYDDFDGDDSTLDFIGKGFASNNRAGIHASFANEIAEGRHYRMRITNANATTQQIILCPSYINLLFGTPLPNGVIKEGAFLSVAGLNLTGAGDPTPISNFLNFIHIVPTRCIGFKVTSTDALQIEESFKIKQMSPFRGLEDRSIVLANYQDENTFRDKVVTVSENFQFDDQTEIRMNIVGNSTMTLTFYCGAMLNNSRGLFQKAQKAQSYIQGKSPNKKRFGFFGGISRRR